MTAERIRIGTRGSALALVQARILAAAFERQGRTTRLVIVETEGDRRAPDTPWGEGAFVAAIERALLDDRVDAAVHSAKDVPTDEDERLRIAAYLPREDPADVLVVREGEEVSSLDGLPRGARVGTDSPRRQGFLLAARPDLRVHPLHGNVDTRLRRLDDGETDALVLAAAGLRRLGRDNRISVRLDPTLVPPAPGQGAIAVQVRRADARMLALAAAVDDPATRAAVEAERRFLAASGGGCRAPIGALAHVERGTLAVLAGRVEPNGSGVQFEAASGELKDADATIDELLRRFTRGDASPDALGRPLVLVTRPEAQSHRLVRLLRERDLDAVVAPTVGMQAAADPGALDGAIARLREFAWAVVTSSNGAAAAVAMLRARSVDAHAARWAAVGNGTAATLREIGIEPWLPSEATGRRIAEELPIETGERVLLLRGNLADAALPSALAARGAIVEEVEAYRTVDGAPELAPGVERALGRPLSAIVLASPSAARGLLALAGPRAEAVRALPAVCIGATTAGAARRLGFTHVVAAARPTAEALADAVAACVGTAEGIRA